MPPPPPRLPYAKKDSLKRSRRSSGTGEGTSPIVSRRGPSSSEYSPPSSYATDTCTARRAPLGHGTTGGVRPYPMKSRSMRGTLPHIRGPETTACRCGSEYGIGAGGHVPTDTADHQRGGPAGGRVAGAGNLSERGERRDEAGRLAPPRHRRADLRSGQRDHPADRAAVHPAADDF